VLWAHTKEQGTRNEFVDEVRRRALGMVDDLRAIAV
jgi:hypothetical protein